MSLARFWRLQTQRYQLGGRVCAQCGAKIVSERAVCPVCHPALYRPADQTRGLAWAIPLFDISVNEARDRLKARVAAAD